MKLAMVFGGLLVAVLIVICGAYGWTEIAITLAIGLVVIILVSIVYPRLSRMRAGFKAAGSEGSLETILHERIQASQQELAQQVSHVVPSDWESEVCGAIEGFTPTMMNLATGVVDVFIERLILDFLKDDPRYSCDVVNHIIAVVCSSPVDEAARQHAVAYVTPIARRMAENGQVVFSEDGTMMRLAKPPECNDEILRSA